MTPTFSWADRFGVTLTPVVREVVDVERECVRWFVPEDEIEAFKEWVVEKHGDTDPYVGFELEEAMREYLDADTLEDVEELSEALLEATGQTSGTTREKNLHELDSPTTKIYHRINPELKERFAKYADRHDHSYGQLLGRAMNERRHGGRENRIRENLEAALPDATAALDRITDDGAGSSDLSLRERRTIAVARELPDTFDEDMLAETIQAEAGVSSTPSIDTYTDRVLDRLDVKRWEQLDDRPDLFMPPEKWAARMTTEIINQLCYTDDWVQEDVDPFTRDEFLRAAGRAGIEATEENREEVNEYRERVTDRLDFVWHDDREEFAPPDRDDVDGTEADLAPGLEEEVTAEFDALEAAEASEAIATDGGRAATGAGGVDGP